MVTRGINVVDRKRKDSHPRLRNKHSPTLISLELLICSTIHTPTLSLHQCLHTISIETNDHTNLARTRKTQGEGSLILILSHYTTVWPQIMTNGPLIKKSGKQQRSHKKALGPIPKLSSLLRSWNYGKLMELNCLRP
jgi:hypothetical protein